MWKPKVEFFAEVVPWNKEGPIGGIPGRWLADQYDAFMHWLEEHTKANPKTLGRFFVRNGKVWGVRGPEFGSHTHPETGAAAGLVTLILPSYWRGEIVLDKVWVDPGGNAVPADEGALRGWVEEAATTIRHWNQVASWEPEIGHIQETSAWGVLPPKDGNPKDWRVRAAVVYDEWKAMEKARDRAFKDREEKRMAKAKLEDDGLGWLSPKHDAYFDSLGINKRQRKVWNLIQEGFDADSLLQECWALVLNPRRFNFGFVNHTFFDFIKRAFHSSQMYLELLYSHANSGNAGQDVEVSRMAGSVLAKHYAKVVLEWKHWDGLGSRKKTDESVPFLSRALSGQLPETGKGSPAGTTWFSSVFNEHLGQPRHRAMKEFLNLALNRAGYQKHTALERKKREIHKAYDERREQAKLLKLPWEPVMTPEESAILAQSDATQEATFQQMTEEEFSYAWDRNKAKAAEIGKIIAQREQEFSPGSSEYYVSAFANPLPIKGVLARELPWLTARFEDMGRTKTVNGKKRNAAAYLSDVEPELRRMARRLFGLG